MMNKALLNVEISHYDQRDVIVEALNQQASYPRSLDYRDKLPMVWDQGADGPCSAYAVAAIKQWQEYKDYGLSDQLSKYFIYNIRPNYPQRGMTPRDTMKVLHQYGVPLAKSYHKRKMKHRQDIPKQIWDEASNHRIAAYGRVMTIEGLKESLYKNGPAYIAMPVFNDSPEFWKPGFGDKVLGGHALVVVGYNRKGFILRNSWGSGWADGGHTIYPYKEFGAHYEIWTLIDEKGSKQTHRPRNRRRFNPLKLLKSIFNR